MMIDGASLAALNALLNATAAVLLFSGWRAIKRKRVQTHRRLMIGAFSVSCVFLASYLARNILFGDKHYEGTGLLRGVYFTILISHVLLAVAAAPMALTTLTLGLRKRIDSHRRWARRTLPIWGYVSVTGVVVYLLLYR